MVCDYCGENEATIHYTEVINGVKSERHLCAECASKIGIAGFSNSNKGELAFVKLLTGLLASSGASGENQDSPAMNVTCPGCKMTYREFAQVGKFGCAECYDVFGPLIEDNIKKLQGSNHHIGKNYDSKNVAEEKAEEAVETLEDKLAVLNAKLKEAIELEEYEDAAKYRDEIKALKEGKNNA